MSVGPSERCDTDRMRAASKVLLPSAGTAEFGRFLIFAADEIDALRVRVAELEEAAMSWENREVELCKMLTDAQPDCWRLTKYAPITHVDGCGCEWADAYTIEQMDPRCVEGEYEPTLIREEGEFVSWALPLGKIAAVLNDDDLGHREQHAVISALLASASLEGEKL